MYGYNNMYNRNIGVPTQPINNQFLQQPQMPLTPTMLQGKTVDSIDVVKALDIPLDGSTSYFPLVDGSAIITKKLQLDGTTKTTIYKISNEQEVASPKYATMDDLTSLEKELKDIINNMKPLEGKKVEV